jgi:hypothetical protein
MGSLGLRLTEPSTYAGLAGISLAVGQQMPQWAAFANLASMVFGGLAMMMSEGASAVPPKPPAA